MSDLKNATGSGVTDTIGNKTLELLPLDLKDLGTLERQALKAYKDNSVSSFVDMAAKYLPAEERSKAIRETIDKVAFMDIDSLPEKEDDMQYEVSPGVIGTRKQKIPWAAWWMQRTFDGMLHFVWLSAKKGNPTLSYDECAKLITLGGGHTKLSSLAKTVDEISQPQLLGN